MPSSTKDKMADRRVVIGVLAVVVLIIALGAFAFYHGAGGGGAASVANGSLGAGPRVIQVVAAENFWGSLMGQVCGVHCNVTSIVTDPNADPHEYEASATNARAISNANLIIINGAGYDDWALKLISASNSPNQTVLNVAGLVGVVNGSNPHLWYDQAYVNATVKQMYLDVVQIDPADAGYYEQNYENVTASLGQLDGRIAKLKQQFGGSRVASTESIFVYLANATGLDLVSPPAFMDAVAEGNDPPVQSVTQFENLFKSGNVSVLVYNEQTVTPLTQQMKQIAVQNNVSIVGVTETIQPQDVSYQTWMNAELIALQNALNANALGN